jgi:D-alanyl-D-alanine carboxypeptidase/D-alanyl-D-alanine-endopeptidase (penicillin-binding protein 4)
MRPLPCPLAGLLLAASLTASLTAPRPLAAQQPPAPDAAIRAVMDRPEFRHAIWGMAFYDLDAKRLVAGVNVDRLFTPGSTTKLLTMGTALEALGPDHRFRTRVYRTGPVRDGVLLGDLVLRASGDPNLSGRVRDGNRYAFVDKDHSYGGMPLESDPLTTIRALAQQVAKAGIRRISGQVMVDASLFPEGERELGTRVVLSPMVVNDNVVDIVLRPGARTGDPVQVSVSPASSYLTVQATLTTADSSTPLLARSVEDSTNPDHRTLVLTGTVPRGAPVNARWAVASPRRFGEIVFAEALQAAGVSAIARLGSRVTDARTFAPFYTDSLVVAEHVSLPLTAEAVVLLKTSQNLHASNFPLLLPALTGGAAGRTGFDIARDWLQKEGLDLDGAQQSDGAGGDALFSPSFMVQYLAMLAKKPWAGAFHDALPILGRDGTLALIQVKAPGAGQVHAKTGTYAKYDALNRRTLVTGKGLAGYVTTRSGRKLAIALYVNNLAVKQGDPADVAGQALGEIASLAWERIK